MKIYRIMVILASVLIVASCNRLDVQGMFFSSGTHTEDRVAQWLEWDDLHGQPFITGAPDNYNVYVCSDIHPCGIVVFNGSLEYSNLIGISVIEILNYLGVCRRCI